MHNIKTILFKELKSYFNSAIAYIVIIVFLVIAGILFSISFFPNNIASLRDFFGNFFIQLILFVVFIPAITMRSFSEEKKQGTLELLLTKPVQDYELIAGKYLAAFLLVCIALIPTLIYCLAVFYLGPLAFYEVISGYIAFLLMSAMYVGIGIFVSSLTENQIVAFIVSVLIALFFFLVGKFLMILPLPLISFFEFLTTDYHFNNITRGVIDTRDVIYYFSMVFFTVFLTKVSLESRKW
jgi:ABC-type transport system involved in multi-copper enzyme maturation permease subunit